MLRKTEYIPDDVSPPRDTLRELLEEKGMSQKELAERIGKTTKGVFELLSDDADVAITPATALQLEKALGISARFWIDREGAYQEAKARRKNREKMLGQLDWLKSLPLNELRRRGYIYSSSISPETLSQVLNFFAVASVESWGSFWAQAQTAYRMSSAFNSDFGHLATWLRCGELESEKISCGAPYDPKNFEKSLSVVAELTTKPIDVIISRMTEIMLRSGVALVFVKEFPKTHVSGAARWIQNKPLIQMSLRYKSDDQFWFTFYHEACHILRHAKKPIYVDDKDPDGTPNEKEANQYARNILIPESAYQKFVNAGRFYDPDICAFAQELHIAPGILVGRLQCDGFLRYNFNNHLKRRFEFSDSLQIMEISR